MQELVGRAGAGWALVGRGSGTAEKSSAAESGVAQATFAMLNHRRAVRA